MMSGDSPDINHPPPKDALLDPKDALALHDLTNAACSSKTDVLQASILVDPHNNKAAICPQVSPIEQRTKATSTTDESIESAADNPMLPRKLQNGTLDTTDLALNTHIGEKQKDDKVDDDDSCGVKCLYYSLQCCECTIM